MNEFEFINRIKKSHRLGKIGDDCAVLPMNEQFDLLLTADMLVEDIDFRIEWTRPEFLGHKALAVSISDVVAMGGAPTFSVLSIGVPEKLWKNSFLESFYAGWHMLAKQVGVELVGGDVSRTPERLVIDSVVLGKVEKESAVLRSGAKPGDKIFVSGSLGGAAGGLKLLETGLRPGMANAGWQEKLMKRQLSPFVRVGLLARIRELQATSMIDISDGLSSDLAHICRSSGVGAILFADKIPVAPELDHLPGTTEDHLELALHGGEDLELLFTSGANEEMIEASDRFTCIGEITEEPEVIKILRSGRIETLGPKGFLHYD
ncbi:thiamine-phosphate kinase [Leptolyngbya sp. 7M]|uniref:thiamine-phosphate kinase n=1 Tax=Leptolyngbya sp. 7M TaxID=2812896 RepID=UPI001B8DA20F|nr:thiamine-phosphate kinase [Leptolyngbya sp. 7M]QYO65987.1 thiamine-phosphate kinase [Leptolyngbya sp. 7M]